ncbi:MAG: HEAT repeat domain-containing protein [Promethearchaeota archaeon]
MSIEIPEQCPEEVKVYINDYNKAFANKDIMEVDLALNGLVSLVFSPDETIRYWSVWAISKIGQIQYKFLKNVIRVLLHRYKGEDEIKRELASIALGEICIGKPAEQLIEDQEILEKIKQEHQERLNKTQAEAEAKKQYLAKAEVVQVDLSSLKYVSDVYAIGQYYNKCMVDDKIEEAAATLRGLITSLFKWLRENPSNFSAGVILFKLIADENKRPPFFGDLIEYLLGFLTKGNEEEKEASKELILHIYESIEDLLSQDLVDWARAENIRRREERDKEKEKEKEWREYIKQYTITPKLKWDVEIQKLCKEYNKNIKTNDHKAIRQLIKPLTKALSSSDELKWKSAGEFLGELLKRVTDIVKPLVLNLLKDYRKPKNSEILSFMTDTLRQLQLAKLPIIETIEQDQKAREAERERIRKEKEEQYKKIEEITVKFEGDWDKKLVKIGDNLNKLLLKKKLPEAQKLLDQELKPLLQANQMEIRSQAQDYFVRIAEKYPDLLSNIVNTYLELYNSDNEARFLAVELFGKTYHAGHLNKIIPSLTDELRKKIEHDYDERRKDIENQLLSEKISHIKIDVQTIPIKDWPKDIQKICRAYNDAILKQNLDEVIKQVQKIVNIFTNDKKKERLEASIEILGLISKKNIELIAPTINMLLKMVDNENKEIKFKAIRALGEVCIHRPGWAYMGLEKLAQIANNDKNDEARMKAMLELSKVGKSNATMLIEYVPNIIKALSEDPNKHVRRLAAWTLGAMAEVIPLEATEAIPALTDALHDEYILVRKFADKALQLIRAAMRKEKR